MCSAWASLYWEGVRSVNDEIPDFSGKKEKGSKITQCQWAGTASPVPGCARGTCRDGAAPIFELFPV